MNFTIWSLYITSKAIIQFEKLYLNITTMYVTFMLNNYAILLNISIDIMYWCNPYFTPLCPYYNWILGNHLLYIVKNIKYWLNYIVKQLDEIFCFIQSIVCILNFIDYFDNMRNYFGKSLSKKYNFSLGIALIWYFCYKKSVYRFTK